jgi:hypothetical protein
MLPLYYIWFMFYTDQERSMNMLGNNDGTLICP